MPQMTKCKACQATISEAAVTCPQCGNPNKKPRTQYGCGTLIGVLVLGFIVVSVWTGNGSQPSKPKAPPTAAELRQQKIENQFSGWDGSHRHLERSVKASLKDPDSYQHIETRYKDNGDSISVFMNYRAKNSFGGYVVNTVVAKYDLSGNLLEAPVSLNE